MTLRVGIVGAGGIGAKRAAALGPEARLVAVADTSVGKAAEVALPRAADFYRFWPDVVARQDIDAVIVSTTHDVLAEVTAAALSRGKHVLVEKPGGRTLGEIERLADRTWDDAILRVGCNHRFHPAFQTLRRFHWGRLGPVMNIRARYGHGGRPGYEKEWRADPAKSGGGELIDQGVHLIDLCNWLTGRRLDLELGTKSTQFWNMPVEDNAVVILKSANNSPSLPTIRATLLLSCTEWKNLFDFEVFCLRGKLQVTGLGRSYGTETLHVYEMGEAMGPPSHETCEYPENVDSSWRREWLGFVKAIAGEQTDNATIADAERAMRVVHELYRRTGASWLT